MRLGDAYRMGYAEMSRVLRDPAGTPEYVVPADPETGCTLQRRLLGAWRLGYRDAAVDWKFENCELVDVASESACGASPGPGASS